MRIAAIDFESYFDKECSITTLGTDGYCCHPQFEVYQVSIVTSDGFEYVGGLAKAPWDKISGDDWTWVSHNRGFDARVHHFLVERGEVPATAKPALWECTADLCAYHGYPRALAMASAAIYKEKVSKEYRNVAKGKRFNELTPERQEQVREAGVVDARTCLRFWNDLSPDWPEHERKLSRMTSEMGWRGMAVDLARVERGISWMNTLCWAAEQKIPWSDDAPALSYPQLVKACKTIGIDAPSSLAISSDECDGWLELHGGTIPWIGAMRIKRRCNAMLKKLQTIKTRVREDGTMPMELKYAGAYPTLRWSGTGGFNPQNLPREASFGPDWFEKEARHVLGDIITESEEGVDLRACLVARQGFKLAISDLAQIEVRCGASLVGDEKAVAVMKKGFSAYDAHAVTCNICTEAELPLKKTDLKRYTFAKGMRLACQYGSGHHKLLQMASIYGLSNEFFTRPVSEAQREAYEEYLSKLKDKLPLWAAMYQSAESEQRTMLINAWLIVMQYRSKDTKTMDTWKSLGETLKQSIGEDMHIGLPSGRQMTYRKVAEFEGEVTASMPEFGTLRRSKLYAAMLFNHLCQGSARDVMADGWLRAEAAGYNVVLTVHDELVVEIPEDGDAQEIAKLMSISPTWWPSLVVSAEAEESKFYCK